MQLPSFVRKFRLPLLGLVSLMLFAWITWPLPQTFLTGIISSHRSEQGPPRSVILGDHLQLMYHFELMKGFLTGETPWLYNLYEFNTGDDAVTYFPDPYYAPFSVIYALGSMLGLPGLGWNVASLVSVLFGMWGTWRLVRSYEAPWGICVAATFCGTFLPYRWVTLLHGSPTGFAMMYVPWILYGLRVSIVDRKKFGGWIAGACVLAAAWGDLHTFFFSALIVPPWCLLMTFSQPGNRLTLKEIGAMAKALSGFIVFGILILFQVQFTRSHLSEGSMSEGRTIEEVALFSPAPSGLWDTNPDNPENLIYLTFSALILLLITSTIGIRHFRKVPQPQKRYVASEGLLLFFGLLMVLILSMGPSLILEIGPKYWRALCTVIPPYEMIRQPTKIFVLVPSLLAVLMVFPFAGGRIKLPKYLAPILLLLGLGIALETGSRIDPTISLLDNGNAAYAAIRSDADAHDEIPRAMAIVLWPGDAHWSSLYQYYAIRHQIRMINGYRPHVMAGYFDDVFMRYNPLNQGYASDEILDHLLNRGIQYLVLHEDAFPEKVSPFGVGQTLAGLLQHPRIQYLERENAIWSFKISPTADAANVQNAPWDIASPTRVWPLSYYGPKPDDTVPELERQQAPGAYQHQFVRLKAGSGQFLKIAPYPTFYRNTLRISLRYRGQGTLSVGFRAGSLETEAMDVELNSDDWSWTEMLFPEFERFENDLGFRFEVTDGALDVDVAMMMDGPSVLNMQAGESLFIPAASLFHAGYTDMTTAEVVMDPDRVPHDEVLYGPRLPFPKGRYRVQFETSGGQPGEQIGALRIRDPHPLSAHPVIAGEALVFEMVQEENLPLVFAFTYFRNASIRIKGITLTRLGNTP